MIEKVPFEALVTLISMCAGQQVEILKKDGCSIKFSSKDFVWSHRKLFKIKKAPKTIKYANLQNTKNSEEVVLDGNIEIDDYR